MNTRDEQLDRDRERQAGREKERGTGIEKIVCEGRWRKWQRRDRYKEKWTKTRG